MMIEGRNIDEAAQRVADMTDDDVLLFAKHDPDMFRHVALGYRAQGLGGLTEAQIKHMVNRFLGWKLPATFNPDNGISVREGGWSLGFEPSGTNLFDATQAEAMVRYMIEGMG